jgi:hypothetical protein
MQECAIHLSPACGTETHVLTALLPGICQRTGVDCVCVCVGVFANAACVQFCVRGVYGLKALVLCYAPLMQCATLQWRADCIL